MGEGGGGGSEKFIRVSYENKPARDEKLYAFTDAGRNNGGLGIGGDIHSCNIHANSWTNLFNNTSRALLPMFFILTEKELTAESVADLVRVEF